jgi:hypothetical protein
MTNIKSFTPKLRNNKRFVLYSVEFIALHEELNACSKNPQAKVDPAKVKELRARKREIKKNIYNTLQALLTEEELALFNESFPNTLDKTLKKFLVDYFDFYFHFAKAYTLQSCFIYNYVRNQSTPEMVSSFRKQADEIRAQYTEEYNW